MTYGRHGTIDGHRYMQPVEPRSRRRCHCGCGMRASHRGMNNGVALSMGCELYIRRWVKQGIEIYRRAVTIAAMEKGA